MPTQKRNVEALKAEAIRLVRGLSARRRLRMTSCIGCVRQKIEAGLADFRSGRVHSPPPFGRIWVVVASFGHATRGGLSRRFQNTVRKRNGRGFRDRRQTVGEMWVIAVVYSTFAKESGRLLTKESNRNTAEDARDLAYRDIDVHCGHTLSIGKTGDGQLENRNEYEKTACPPGTRG